MTELSQVEDDAWIKLSNYDLSQWDSTTIAVLHAMEQAAEKHLDDLKPYNTKRSYENDWDLWQEFHVWLAERTGHELPLTAATKGTMVGFVTWLDTVKIASPNSIDRRITGVTVTLRDPPYGIEIPKSVTVAARQALKPLKQDTKRMARGRGQAHAATPEDLRKMSATVAEGITGIRDRALWLMSFGIAGRSVEISSLDLEHVVLKSRGLLVSVPPAKGRPGRKVPVLYGKNVDTCPVRAWITWSKATNRESGPAFLPVDAWGRIQDHRLSPNACRDIISRNAEKAKVLHRLTVHSMRAGFITTSRLAGKREEKIREQSGHAENSPVFWRYIREADAWIDAASEDIGL